MAQSNPIQQRMEQLGEMWNDSVKNAEIKVVLIRVAKNEEEMIEAFFDYMLGVDTDIMDIAIQFQTPINEPETFSRELVEELAALVNEWNTADKKESFPFTAIHWAPDYAVPADKNTASLFVKNVNRLTSQLDLAEEVYVAPILFLYTSDAKKANDWIKNVIEATLHPQIKIVITDTFEEPLFNTCLEKYPGLIVLLTPEFNMPQVMQQLAAMGNPNDPETKYRFAFMKLTNAVAAQKSGEIKDHAGNCIRIASENIDKNPYWIGQIMAVYFTLGIYEVSVKEFEKAIDYATKALDTALSTIGKISDEMSFRNIGQAAMFRGSLYCQQEEWEKAMEDFNSSDIYYGNCKDYILRIEALRMKAYAAKKCGIAKEEVNCLVAATRLGSMLNPSLAEASSYRIVLQSLLLTRFQKELPIDELNGIVTPLLGDDWEETIAATEITQ